MSADSKSASSLRSLPQAVEFSVSLVGKLIVVYPRKSLNITLDVLYSYYSLQLRKIKRSSVLCCLAYCVDDDS